MLSRLKEVEICDELESFFYVILYYAVRYLDSNIDDKDVGNWIHHFFDVYDVRGDTYVCGQVKLNAIKRGELAISPDEDLKFESPMDNLLVTLLRLFKAHHTVNTYHRKRTKLSTIPELKVSFANSSEPTEPPWRVSQVASEERVAVDWNSLIEEENPAPSKKDLFLHNLLTAHEAMLERLTLATREKWKSSDRRGDRVPANSRPQPQNSGPTEPASVVYSKRAKLNGQVAALHHSPGFPPPRPPKTTEDMRPFSTTTRYAELQRY